MKRVTIADVRRAIDQALPRFTYPIPAKEIRRGDMLFVPEVGRTLMALGYSAGGYIEFYLSRYKTYGISVDAVKNARRAYQPGDWRDA